MVSPMEEEPLNTVGFCSTNWNHETIGLDSPEQNGTGNRLCAQPTPGVLNSSHLCSSDVAKTVTRQHWARSEPYARARPTDSSNQATGFWPYRKEGFNYAKALTESDRELEMLSKKIRAEIQQSEMFEMAVEAERAANAGLQSFSAKPSTFGRDEVPMQRNLTLEEPTKNLDATRRMASRRVGNDTEKIGLLKLRNVADVVPPWKELHSQMRTHLHRSKVSEASLSFYEFRPKNITVQQQRRSESPRGDLSCKSFLESFADITISGFQTNKEKRGAIQEIPSVGNVTDRDDHSSCSSGLGQIGATLSSHLSPASSCFAHEQRNELYPRHDGLETQSSSHCNTTAVGLLLPDISADGRNMTSEQASDRKPPLPFSTFIGSTQISETARESRDRFRSSLESSSLLDDDEKEYCAAESAILHASTLPTLTGPVELPPPSTSDFTQPGGLRDIQGVRNCTLQRSLSWPNLGLSSLGMDIARGSRNRGEESQQLVAVRRFPQAPADVEPRSVNRSLKGGAARHRDPRSRRIALPSTRAPTFAAAATPPAVLCSAEDNLRLRSKPHRNRRAQSGSPRTVYMEMEHRIDRDEEILATPLAFTSEETGSTVRKSHSFQTAHAEGSVDLERTLPFSQIISTESNAHAVLRRSEPNSGKSGRLSSLCPPNKSRSSVSLGNGGYHRRGRLAVVQGLRVPAVCTVGVRRTRSWPPLLRSGEFTPGKRLKDESMRRSSAVTTGEFTPSKRLEDESIRRSSAVTPPPVDTNAGGEEVGFVDTNTMCHSFRSTDNIQFAVEEMMARLSPIGRKERSKDYFHTDHENNKFLKNYFYCTKGKQPAAPPGVSCHEIGFESVCKGIAFLFSPPQNAFRRRSSYGSHEHSMPFGHNGRPVEAGGLTGIVERAFLQVKHGLNLPGDEDG